MSTPEYFQGFCNFMVNRTDSHGIGMPNFLACGGILILGILIFTILVF